eukprot:9589206-Ditylum_brightwellii.AAC.1
MDSGSFARSSNHAISPGDSMAVRRTKLVTLPMVVASGEAHVKEVEADSGVALAITSVFKRKGVCGRIHVENSCMAVCVSGRVEKSLLVLFLINEAKSSRLLLTYSSEPKDNPSIFRPVTTSPV